MTIVDKIQSLRDELKARYAGAQMGELVDLVLTAVVSKSDLLIIGPTGSGKTELVLEIANALELSRAIAYYSANGREEPIIGPLSLKALQEDDLYIRKVDGYLPAVQLFIGDEIGRASVEQLEATMPIFSQRQYTQGGQLVEAPLWAFIGISNSQLPRNARMEAVNDRFELRCILEDDRECNEQILKWGFSPEERPRVKTRLNSSELNALVAAADKIHVSEGVLESIIETVNRYEEFLSKRRISRIAQKLKAYALVTGSRRVTHLHTTLLENILPSWVEELPQAQQVVNASMRTLSEAQARMRFSSIKASVPAGPRRDKELRELVETLEDFGQREFAAEVAKEVSGEN